MIDVHHLRRLQDRASRGTWKPGASYAAIVSDRETRETSHENFVAYGGFLVAESASFEDRLYICAMHNSLTELLNELEEHRDREERRRTRRRASEDYELP